MSNCDMTDDCAVTFGAYFAKKQIEKLSIGGNKFSFKAMAKLLEDLTLSAESGRLLSLDISDTISDLETKK